MFNEICIKWNIWKYILAVQSDNLQSIWMLHAGATMRQLDTAPGKGGGGGGGGGARRDGVVVGQHAYSLPVSPFTKCK